MGVSRECTKAEKLFDEAFLEMRNLDKSIWYNATGRQPVGREDFDESVTIITRCLEQAVNALFSER